MSCHLPAHKSKKSSGSRFITYPLSVPDVTISPFTSFSAYLISLLQFLSIKSEYFRSTVNSPYLTLRSSPTAQQHLLFRSVFSCFFRTAQKCPIKIWPEFLASNLSACGSFDVRAARQWNSALGSFFADADKPLAYRRRRYTTSFSESASPAKNHPCFLQSFEIFCIHASTLRHCQMICQ